MAEIKKTTFVYKGLDRSGGKVEGEVDGLNADLVKAQLRTKGIIASSVKKKPASLFGGGGGKITAGDIAVFARQMTTMMKSGVPLVQSFEILANGTDNPAMKTLIFSIKSDVEGGASMAQALAKHPKQFDDLFVSLVEAGEQSGTLEDLLNKIATYKEKTEAIKKKVKKALSYPIIVLVVAFVVTAILLIYVVPQFESTFSSFGADLPAPTRFVVSLSEWMQANWIFVFGAVIIAAIAFFEAKKRIPKFSHWVDKMSLKAPIFGNITEKSILARFSRTLATMFAAGVPLIEAMDSVAGATNNYIYEQATYKVRDEVATGDQLNQSMKRSGLFPNMLLSMVAIGEESGNVDEMLNRVADFYEEEVDNAVDAMSAAMEPMIMAFLGVIIGGLVVSMYLPIFKMGEAV